MLIKRSWRCCCSLSKWNDRWITFSPQAEPPSLVLMSDLRDQVLHSHQNPLTEATQQLQGQVRKGKCGERHLGTWRVPQRGWLCFHSLSWCQYKASGYWKQVHKSGITAGSSAREGRTVSQIFKTTRSSCFVSFSVVIHSMAESDQMSVGCEWIFY